MSSQLDSGQAEEVCVRGFRVRLHLRVCGQACGKLDFVFDGFCVRANNWPDWNYLRVGRTETKTIARQNNCRQIALGDDKKNLARKKIVVSQCNLTTIVDAVCMHEVTRGRRVTKLSLTVARHRHSFESTENRHISLTVARHRHTHIFDTKFYRDTDISFTAPRHKTCL